MLRGFGFAALILHSGLAFGQPPQEPPECKEARDKVEQLDEQRKAVNKDYGEKLTAHRAKQRQCEATHEKEVKDCWKPYHECKDSTACSKARDEAKTCARESSRREATCDKAEWDSVQEVKETSYHLTLKENAAAADERTLCVGVRPRPRS